MAAVAVPRQTWRTTTAARAFGLALATGLTLSSPSPEGLAVLLVTLWVMAATFAALEYDAAPTTVVWVPVAEGVIAAALLATVDAPVDPLCVYLAVPPLVAGLRHGLVTTINTVLAEALTLLGVLVAAESFSRSAVPLRSVAPWLVVGLGAGLLAVWLRRSTRAAESQQAPYLAAHRLLGQLHSVSRQLPTGLDLSGITQAIVERTQDALPAERVILLLGEQNELQIAADSGHGQPDELVELDPLVRQSVARREPRWDRTKVALSLRVGDRALGAVLADRPRRFDKDQIEQLQAELDEHSLRLETALLFDDVRRMATREERRRLAREIHDGVAQEIASLGYLVDDLIATSESAEAQRAAGELRTEMSRVVGELRLSIFDLRHELHGSDDLGRVLSDYAHQIGERSNLRVHLELQGAAPRLLPRVQSELLRIAQEAIVNVRKHARADNLWVRLGSRGAAVRLSIEDDGIGGVAARVDHYGLHGMRERAERIGAHLTITERSGGGTTVTVDCDPTALSKGQPHDHHRASR